MKLKIKYFLKKTKVKINGLKSKLTLQGQNDQMCTLFDHVISE